MRDKGRCLIQSNDKRPYIIRKSTQLSDKTKTPQENFDYTAIPDRIRAVNYSNFRRSNGVVKLVYWRPTRKSYVIKHELRILHTIFVKETEDYDATQVERS